MAVKVYPSDFGQGWNTAWGVIAAVVPGTSVAQTGITAQTDITGLSITWIAIPGRRYRTSLYIARAQQLTNAAEIQTAITDGANVGKQLGAFVATPNGIFSGTVVYVEPSSISGSTVRKGRMFSSAASLTIDHNTAYPCTLQVEDMGPFARSS